MISFQTSINLSQSANITYENMRSYYEYYSVVWKHEQILEQISGLENWDILLNQSVVGAVRLSYENSVCWIRDLQVSQQHQNKGIGARALGWCEQKALKASATELKLRVFKTSPAYHLYQRNGFKVDKDEERFFYMKRSITL